MRRVIYWDENEIFRKKINISSPLTHSLMTTLSSAAKSEKQRNYKHTVSQRICAKQVENGSGLDLSCYTKNRCKSLELLKMVQVSIKTSGIETQRKFGKTRLGQRWWRSGSRCRNTKICTDFLPHDFKKILNYLNEGPNGREITYIINQ